MSVQGDPGPLVLRRCVCCETVADATLTVTRVLVTPGRADLKRTHEYSLCRLCIARMAQGWNISGTVIVDNHL